MPIQQQGFEMLEEASPWHINHLTNSIFFLVELVAVDIPHPIVGTIPPIVERDAKAKVESNKDFEVGSSEQPHVLLDFDSDMDDLRPCC